MVLLFLHEIFLLRLKARRLFLLAFLAALLARLVARRLLDLTLLIDLEDLLLRSLPLFPPLEADLTDLT